MIPRPQWDVSPTWRVTVNQRFGVPAKNTMRRRFGRWVWTALLKLRIIDHAAVFVTFYGSRESLAAHFSYLASAAGEGAPVLFRTEDLQVALAFGADDAEAHRMSRMDQAMVGSRRDVLGRDRFTT